MNHVCIVRLTSGQKLFLFQEYGPTYWILFLSIKMRSVVAHMITQGYKFCVHRFQDMYDSYTSIVIKVMFGIVLWVEEYRSMV